MEARAHFGDGPLAWELEEMQAPSSPEGQFPWKWVGVLA